MPTPYGSRGGMAFGVEELRVLRRALALALHPTRTSAEDVKDCLRLAESLDEAIREGARLRAFLVADLARYRAALPGAAVGYLALLEEALSAGHRPTPDDLAALRALRGNHTAAALLLRCQVLAEQDVRARLAGRHTRPTPIATAPTATVPTATVPASRTRLLALPGGLSGGLSATGEGLAQESAKGKDPEKKPAQKPAPKPAPKPTPAPAPGPTPNPAAPEPARRPIPTPGEVFPRRKPTPPPANPHQLAAG